MGLLVISTPVTLIRTHWLGRKFNAMERPSRLMKRQPKLSRKYTTDLPAHLENSYGMVRTGEPVSKAIISV